MQGRNLGCDQSGSSAIEFALLAPLLLILSLGLIDGWSLASFMLDMRATVSSAAGLYLQGAGNDALVKELALDAWQNKPADADLSIERSMICSEGTIDEEQMCDGERAPQIHISITASATWNPPFMVDQVDIETMSHSHVVRIR